MSKLSPNSSYSDKTKAMIKDCLMPSYLLRKTFIFKRPTDYQKLNLKAPDAHLYTHKYKTDVLKYWNSKDLTLLNNFSREDIIDITQYCQLNKYAVLYDIDPLVTCGDLASACKSVGLQLDDFRSYCYQYTQLHPWMPSIYPAMQRLFSPLYAVNLKKRVDAWIDIVD